MIHEMNRDYIFASKATVDGPALLLYGHVLDKRLIFHFIYVIFLYTNFFRFNLNYISVH